MKLCRVCKIDTATADTQTQKSYLLHHLTYSTSSMANNLSISIHDHSKSASEIQQPLRDKIRNGLISYNLDKIPDLRRSDVLLCISDGTGKKIYGGLVGRIAWDWLHIELLWVDETVRKQGWGGKLLGEAEQIAIESGCVGAHLDSADFQAPDFYRQQGYEIFGRIEGKPRNHTTFFLKKYFEPPKD